MTHLHPDGHCLLVIKARISTKELGNKTVAFWFRIPESTYEHPPSVQGSGETTVITKEGKRIVFRGTRSTCPKCRESDRYHEGDRSREGLVECRECGHRFYVEPIESLLEKLGENVETRYTTDL